MAQLSSPTQHSMTVQHSEPPGGARASTRPAHSVSLDALTKEADVTQNELASGGRVWGERN